MHDGKPSVWDVAVSRPRIRVLSVFHLWLNNNVVWGAVPPHLRVRSERIANRKRLNGSRLVNQDRSQPIQGAQVTVAGRRLSDAQ